MKMDSVETTEHGYRRYPVEDAGIVCEVTPVAEADEWEDALRNHRSAKPDHVLAEPLDRVAFCLPSFAFGHTKFIGALILDLGNQDRKGLPVVPLERQDATVR